MSCQGCYNGCADPISDRCVKYTGLPVELLHIDTGDPLSKVEKAITDYLVTVADGTGIIPLLDTSVICDLVAQFLPCCNPLTLVDIINALIKAACSLQDQVNSIDDVLATLNGNYTIGACLTVDPAAGTHDILQAVIDELCLQATDITNLVTSLGNYVLIADIDTYIAAYLASLGTTTKMYNRMVPYVAVEYYGSLSNFDITGAGIGDWDKIYLCNGLHGTPDKRGRIPVGTVSEMGGGPLDPVVDPAIDPIFNTDYGISVNNKEGSNSVQLTVNTLASHTHTATADASEHHHTITNANSYTGPPSSVIGGSGANDPLSVDTSTAVPPVTVSVVNSNTGGGEAHENRPPVLACHYVMYIP